MRPTRKMIWGIAGLVTVLFVSIAAFFLFQNEGVIGEPNGGATEDTETQLLVRGLNINREK